MAASAGSRLAKQLRLWRLAGRMDLLFLSRSVRTGVAWYFADMLLGLSGAVWAFLLAERFDGIGPWSRRQIAFLLGFALLVRGVVDVALQHERLVPEPAHRPRPARPHAAHAAAALADDRERRVHAVLGLGPDLRGRGRARPTRSTRWRCPIDAAWLALRGGSRAPRPP